MRLSEVRTENAEAHAYSGGWVRAYCHAKVRIAGVPDKNDCWPAAHIIGECPHANLFGAAFLGASSAHRGEKP